MNDFDSKPMARCMGGRFCTHSPGECTADPAYQAWLATRHPEADKGPSVVEPAFNHSRDEINALGRALQAIRPHNADLIVSFGVHPPSADCSKGHTSVTLRRGGEEITTEAVSLHDALFMAQARMTALEARRAAEREKPASVGRNPKGFRAPRINPSRDGAIK